jgi:UDP-N-acetylmuramoyl-tripeptide--D-alanyl-D-alanine ligase
MRRRTVFALALLVLLAADTVLARTARAQQSRFQRSLLDASLALGTDFLLNNQKPAGNFNYEYDFVARSDSPAADSEVRQAGTLWGLALIHHDSPSSRTARAVDAGLAFFRKHARALPDGRLLVAYPGVDRGRTGAAALVTLAVVERLRAIDDRTLRAAYEKDLDRYVAFLLSLRGRDGRFFGEYRLDDGSGFGRPSPYSDGEALLALVKAARYLGYEHLRPALLESAESMYLHHVELALAEQPDSDITKGFFQWGLMAFHEMYTAGWPGTESYADRAIAMARWMIDVHRTLDRPRNTAYAQEGLIVAADMAERAGRKADASRIREVIDQALLGLTSWQVGGPRENEYLARNPTKDPRAVGGVMNGREDPRLRIDVTQHQMHALILARRWIYRD